VKAWLSGTRLEISRDRKLAMEFEAKD